MKEQTGGGIFRSISDFPQSEWGSNVMNWLLITPSGAIPLTVQEETLTETH